jgi:hypothetical protein
MRTTILLAVCASLLCLGCFEVKVGTQKINVYEQYPVYAVEQRPALANLTGEDNDPHKAVSLLADKIMADGVVTPAEKVQFADAMQAAELARVNALNKKVNNDRALIKWGRMNQATVETYNEYAKDKNERLKIANSTAK